MCGCKDVQIGGYDNQIIVLCPFTNRFICIDRCIFDEVTLLWSQDIITNGCCCGHNKVDGFIGVEFQFIQMMKRIGYEVQYNPMRPNDEDSFKPKTI